MVSFLGAIVLGLGVLSWSAERFIAGSAAMARIVGISPLAIGMIVVGFGTSSPELVVSLFAALEQKSGIAIGNAYGSNIVNIALILGLTACICPVTVGSRIVRREMPLLVLVTLLAVAQVADGFLSRWDALVLLVVQVAIGIWMWRQVRVQREDSLVGETEIEYAQPHMSLRAAAFWIAVGLVLLIASSRLLVWGAVGLAEWFRVDDLIVGLTLVALGTSLPELASSIVATRKGEHQIVLGNVVGSNFLNTLAVVGVAVMVHPTEVSEMVVRRDAPVMAGLTLFMLVAAIGRRGPGRIGWLEGGLLLSAYVAYTTVLIVTATVR